MAQPVQLLVHGAVQAAVARNVNVVEHAVIVQGHRCPAPGVPGALHEHVWRRDQLAAHQAWWQQARRAEAEIDLAAFQPARQVGFVRTGQPQLQLPVALRLQPPRQAGQHDGRGRIIGGQREDARRPCRVEVVRGGAHGRRQRQQCRLQPAMQLQGERRWRQAASALGGHQQRVAEQQPQARQLRRERRLAQVQAHGRPRDVALLQQHVQRDQQWQVRAAQRCRRAGNNGKLCHGSIR
nr:hypothetical protein [Pseudoduganella plicata]